MPAKKNREPASAWDSNGSSLRGKNSLLIKKAVGSVRVRFLGGGRRSDGLGFCIESTTMLHERRSRNDNASRSGVIGWEVMIPERQEGCRGVSPFSPWFYPGAVFVF